MKNYLSHITVFFYRFILLIALFTVSRILFYAFNANYFSDIDFFHLLKILFAGIRFDISALYYFNIPFIVFSLVPGNFKNKNAYQKVLFILFIVTNSILLAFNFIDTKFFDFEHKRLTSDFFNSVWLGEDFITLLPQFLKDYWYLLILWILSIFALVKFYPKLNFNKLRSDKISVKQYAIHFIVFLFLMGLGLLGGRGGFQLKPLRVIHATKYTPAKNVALILNTPFTIMKSIDAEAFQPKKYFSKTELDTIYSPVISFNHKVNGHNQNIVLIILESFSREYIGALNNGFGYTPFLDSLIQESLVFTHAFANGKRSIEAMPSIIAGLPALTDDAYITSKFSVNKINAIPNTLKKLGYYSAFFHGGKNGTMGFDQFANVAGFDDYFGMDEYPDKNDYDGNWGIYDEPYLQYFGKKMTEFKQPFFASVFTLTSHHPYEIPEKYKDKFIDGTLNIHESIGYTDYSLNKFFESVKNTEWYPNTLFILVADHTAQAEKPYYKSRLGNYAIPIILFHPGDSTIRGKSDIIAQQSDIFPTILDYLEYNDSIVCYGNSLLNDNTARFSINYINGIYQLIQNDYLLQFDGNKSIAFYSYKNDSLLTQNIAGNDSARLIHYENKIKAIIQSYETRLSSNKLSLD